MYRYRHASPKQVVSGHGPTLFRSQPLLRHCRCFRPGALSLETDVDFVPTGTAGPRAHARAQARAPLDVPGATLREADEKAASTIGALATNAIGRSKRSKTSRGHRYERGSWPYYQEQVAMRKVEDVPPSSRGRDLPQLGINMICPDAPFTAGLVPQNLGILGDWFDPRPLQRIRVRPLQRIRVR